MSVHFSSQRLDWKTPKAVYRKLDDEFHFDCDPCPAENNFDYRTASIIEQRKASDYCLATMTTLTLKL